MELNTFNSSFSYSISARSQKNHFLCGNEVINFFELYYNLPNTTLSLELTYRCNLRCPGCWVRQNEYVLPLLSSNDQTRMTREMLEKTLLMGRNLGIVRLQLIGGEPMFYPNLVQTVRKAILMGYRRVSITTNGVCSWKKIEEVIQAGITDISFSIDGSTAKVHDTIRPSLTGCSTFPITIKNLQKTLTISEEVGFNVRVNHTLFPPNYNNAEAMVRFVADLGVKMIRVHYAFPFPSFGSFDSTKSVEDQGGSLCFVSPSKWLFFQHRCTELSEQLGVEIVIPRIYGKDEVRGAEARRPSYLVVEPDGNLIMCSTHGMVFHKERRNFATIVSDRSILLNPHSLLFHGGNSKCCKAIPHLILQLPDKIRLKVEEAGGIGCIYVKSPLGD